MKTSHSMNWPLVVVLVLMFASAVLGQKLEAKIIFPDYGFCVAYVLRDADKRDVRPADPDDPYRSDKKETVMPYGSILEDDSVVDVAALASRSTSQKVLDKVGVSKLKKGVFDSSAENPIKDCYDPHHVFVFYTHSGKPVACIEVCFLCNRVKMSPKIKDTTDHLNSFETVDLLAIAKLFDSHGMSLLPYASLKEYSDANHPKKRSSGY